MGKYVFHAFLFIFLSSGFCLAQQEIPLYPGTVPNSKHIPDQEESSDDGSIIRKVSRPTLTVFLPVKEKATGSAVIICPGGGYQALVAKREGSDLAKAFNELGVAAFVLKYRLPSDDFQMDKSIAPLQDAQQAIKRVREGSKAWNIDSTKIGIMGFSAGGHLAATAGTQFGSPVIENPENTSLRPDFMILIYPVISFTDSVGHVGSRNFLLGEGHSKDQVRHFSNEFQVKSDTPPAFITHGANDTVVPVANSLKFYLALQQNQIPAELHIYAKGEHGYLQTPVFQEWFGRVKHWMKSMEWVE